LRPDETSRGKEIIFDLAGQRPFPPGPEIDLSMLEMELRVLARGK
jgi:hypothetical protein